MANNLGARAIFVFTRRGYMANFLSRCRPDCPIFAFTGLSAVCTRQVIDDAGLRHMLLDLLHRQKMDGLLRTSTGVCGLHPSTSYMNF